MNIDVNSIVKKMDIEKLIKENIESRIINCIDVESIVDNALEDEKLRDSIDRKVADIIEDYLSSDDGKKCVIEKFKEIISDPDVLLDSRVSNIIIDFMAKALTERL
jgi:uncharacterized membrane protein YheB (UPF0754 family)